LPTNALYEGPQVLPTPAVFASTGTMMNYRIIPNRGTYKVEFIDPNGKGWVVGTWRTEEAAVSHLRKLQEQAQRADYRSAQGEPT
jgi:hypothetical protein